MVMHSPSGPGQLCMTEIELPYRISSLCLSYSQLEAPSWYTQSPPELTRARVVLVDQDHFTSIRIISSVATPMTNIKINILMASGWHLMTVGFPILSSWWYYNYAASGIDPVIILPCWNTLPTLSEGLPYGFWLRSTRCFAILKIVTCLEGYPHGRCRCPKYPWAAGSVSLHTFT